MSFSASFSVYSSLPLACECACWWPPFSWLASAGALCVLGFGVWALSPGVGGAPCGTVRWSALYRAKTPVRCDGVLLARFPSLPSPLGSPRWGLGGRWVRLGPAIAWPESPSPSTNSLLVRGGLYLLCSLHAAIASFSCLSCFGHLHVMPCIQPLPTLQYV